MASYEVVFQPTIYFCNKAHCLDNCLPFLFSIISLSFLKKSKTLFELVMSA